MVLKKLASALVIAWTTVGLATAQEGGSITFKFRVDESAFAEVANSADLVRALRDSTRIDMGISMDSQLWVDMRGYVGDPNRESQLIHLLLPQVRVALKGEQSIEDFSWAEAVAESHGDDFPDDGDRWDEQEVEGWTADDAWAAFLRPIDEGLPESSEGFGPVADGEHQPLRVTGVEVRSFEYNGAAGGENGADFFQCCYLEHGVTGPAIVLKPDLSWDTGRFPADGDIDYSVDALIIQFEPTAEPAPPAAPDAGEVAKMLAGRSCASLVPGGAAEITIDGASREGGAVYRRGPNGEIMVVIGALDGDAPTWCLVIASAEPVEDGGSYAVVDPGTMMQTRESITAVFQEPAEGQSLFWSSDGLVRFRIGEIAEGRLQLEGVQMGSEGDGRQLDVTGWFEAAPLE